MELNEEKLDDLNSSLNTILDLIKRDTSEFPPLDLLDEIKLCLECLASSSKSQVDNQRARFVSISWPADLRVILQRLFRTFKIAEEYIRLCYELSNFAAQCLGAEWIKSDLQFLRLLASLSSGRLRVILDKPEEVDIVQLIACLQLQEFFIGCIEDEAEWLGDDDATFVSNSCQEACKFVCEYVTACVSNGVNVSMQMELFLVLYRFVCLFLAVGGAQIVEKRLLDGTLPVLIKVCKYSISQRDHETAWFLLQSIAQFDSLPSDVLGLFVEYAGLALSSSPSGTNVEKEVSLKLNHSRQMMDALAIVLEQLQQRKGWFTLQSLKGFEQFVKASGSKPLEELLVKIKREEAEEEHQKVENNIS